MFSAYHDNGINVDLGYLSVPNMYVSSEPVMTNDYIALFPHTSVLA